MSGMQKQPGCPLLHDAAPIRTYPSPTPVSAFRGSSRNPVSALETVSHLDPPPETESPIDPEESTKKYISMGTRCPSRTSALHTALAPASPSRAPPSETAKSGKPPVALTPPA